MNMNQLSVILQGAISPCTANIIKGFREAAPGCEIILSTWTRDESLTHQVDAYIINADPGTLPVTYQGQIIRVENVNRQIISTVAGLKQTSKKFSIKWRTDFEVDSKKLRKFLKVYLTKIESSSVAGRDLIVVSAINTANPYAGIGLIGHVSDWVYLGRTQYLLRMMPTKTIASEKINTEIPADRVHKKIFPFARFSVEQWMLRDGLRGEFDFYSDTFSAPDMIRKFLTILGRGFIVVNPRTMGLISHKYDDFIYLNKSSFRKFVGFYLATISEFDSVLLSSPILRDFGVTLLRLKALIFNFYQYIKEK